MNFLPPNSNMFDLENLQRLAQLNQYNQQNYYVNQPQTDLYTELQNQMQSLTTEEKQALSKIPEFVNANSMYEQGLLQFIAQQYRQQFNNSPEGNKCLKNLEGVLNNSLSKVRSQLESEKDEIRKVSELIKNNPEILELLNK